MGLSFLEMCGALRGDEGFAGSKFLPCFSPSSISFPSRNLFFSSSAIVKVSDFDPDAKECTGSTAKQRVRQTRYAWMGSGKLA